MRKKPVTDLHSDRWLTNRPTYLTSMDRCTPASALASDAAHHKWRVIPYESERLKGTLILAGNETEAPTVRLPLGVRGWHAVSIGAWRLKDWYQEGGPSELLVRLSGEPTFSILRLPTRPPPADPVDGWHDWTGGEELSECFWQIVEMSGRDLEFGQTGWTETDRDGAELRRCAMANAAYVKLIPLTEAEVDVVAKDRATPARKPLYAHNDVMMTHTNSPEELRRHFAPFADSDFTRIYWEGAMGDLAYYFQTRNRTPEAPGRDDFLHASARQEAECWRRWRLSGDDPLQIAADATREAGLEFHVCHRLGGFRLPPIHDSWDHGDSFFKAHPEWHGRDREGRPTPRLSFAFPEVRAHVIETFAEMTAYGIDGTCLLYNRRHPLVEYEEPVVDGFRQQHGEDPRNLPADDPLWLQYRAGMLTTFTRELKEALGLPITAIAMSSEKENLANGLDPQAWVVAGLVDTLVPYTDLPEWNHTARAWQKADSLAAYAEMTDGAACMLAPCFQPADLTAEDYRQTADRLAAQGADGFFFWWADVGSVAGYGAPWDAVRRLGHQQEIEAWKAAGEPSLEAPVIRLDSLGGWNSDYVTPA
jgi:hypothetical protein